MDKFDRFQLLHRHLMSRRRPVPLAELARRLECSDKTVKRTIEQMRDYLDAPLQYFPEERGWHYASKADDLYELPGLWLTGAELQSLTLLLHVLEGFGNGLLNEELSSTEQQIQRLLEARGISPSHFAEHIKVLPLMARTVANRTFADVGEAILRQRQLHIHYRDYANKGTQRDISPQTLVYYRENWYLDAWCHLRQGLRTFSLARIEKLEKRDQQSQKIEKAQLHQHFAQSYGIFAGKPKHIATLRFFPQLAREIAMQQWHPEQQGEWQGDDYLLRIPYNDSRELVQDILRHVPHVYVEAPVKLRQAVQNRLHGGLEVFAGKRIRRL